MLGRRIVDHDASARLLVSLAAAISAAAAAPIESRAIDVWDGGGSDSTWSNAKNWNPDGLPVNDGSAQITFAGTLQLSPDLDSSRSIASLTFDSPAGAFTLGSSNASLLTIGAGGITQNDNDTQTINHALALSAPQTWTAAAGSLAINGPVNIGSHALTLVRGSDPFKTFTFNGIISGSGSLIVSGGSAARCSGSAANTLTGTVSVLNGNLSLLKTAGVNAIAGNLIIGDHTTSAKLASVIQASDQIADSATVTVRRSGFYSPAELHASETIASLFLEDGWVATGLGTLTVTNSISSINFTPGAQSTFSGNLNLGGGVRPVVSSAGNTLNLGANVSNGGISFQGDGTLNLSGINTFSSALNINAGTVRLQGGAAIADATSVNILTGGKLDVAASETIGALSGGGTNGGNVAIATGQTLTIIGGGTFGGVISGDGNLAKGSGADLLLRGNNTFTGKTSVSGGAIDIIAPANLGAPPAALVADQLQLSSGATLKVTSTSSLAATRGIALSGAGAFDVASAQSLTLSGPISGAGALTKRGGGTLQLAATNSFSGKTSLEAGTVIAQSDSSFGTAPAALVADQLSLAAATLRWTATNAGIAATRGIQLNSTSSTLSVDGGQTLLVNSPISGPGGLTKVGTGTLNLLGGNTWSAATSVGAGRLIFNNTFVSGNPMIISAGAVVELAEAAPLTLRVSTLNAVGRLDVKNDKVILSAQPIGSWTGNAYNGVTGLIQSGRNNGAWNGMGMMTSMPAATSGLTTLAVATAEQTRYAGGTFGGVSVVTGDVLVMYTYAGDANLDGFISADDYTAIDFNIQQSNIRGYANGDFNYDGLISADDYTIIDFNIIAQGPPFPTAVAGPMPLASAVPEPGMGAACGFGVFGLLARRHRSRRLC